MFVFQFQMHSHLLCYIAWIAQEKLQRLPCVSRNQWTTFRIKPMIISHWLTTQLTPAWLWLLFPLVLSILRFIHWCFQRCACDTPEHASSFCRRLRDSLSLLKTHCSHLSWYTEPPGRHEDSRNPYREEGTWDADHFHE